MKIFQRRFNKILSEDLPVCLFYTYILYYLSVIVVFALLGWIFQ